MDEFSAMPGYILPKICPMSLWAFAQPRSLPGRGLDGECRGQNPVISQRRPPQSRGESILRLVASKE